MNNPEISKIAGVIELFLDHSSRVNQKVPNRYWYPLSMATYGSEEILHALDSLCAFRTSMWEKTSAFESAFSSYQGAQTSVMVNSGSSADLLLCYLLSDPRGPRLQPGDEILIPVVTWPTQIWSAMMAGFKVTLVDVDPQTLNVDLNDLRRKIGPRTKALFMVHLMGNPVDMNAVCELAKAHDLVLIEDCCEALGSEFDCKKVGNFGLCGSFSFFFSHHMCTMEGGMVSSVHPEVTDSLKMLRAHGWTRNLASGSKYLEGCDIDPRYAFVNWGFNLRPTELQAGFGLCQLEKLPGFNARRHDLATRFFTAMKKWPSLKPPVAHPLSAPAWFALPIMVQPSTNFTRAQITEFLEHQGVETRPIVAGNLARHPVAKVFPDVFSGQFPGADKVHNDGFYLGLSPMTSDKDMDRLIELIDGFVASN